MTGRQKNPMRQSWLGEGETEGWVAHRLELLLSPAWRARPIPLCRILERLEVEHMRHAGKENGGLCVSYAQFVASGVSRRAIRPAIAAGERLGLLCVTVAGDGVRPARAKATADHIEPPNVYRLTYLPERGKRAPSDEWAGITDDLAEAAVSEFRNSTGKQKRQFPFPQASSSLFRKESGPASSLSDSSPVPERVLPSISATSPGTALTGEPRPPSRLGRDERAGQAGGPFTAGEAIANSQLLRKLRRGVA